MCMSFVTVGRTIVSYVAFKMAALWFWTMPPSPVGRGYPSRSLIYNFYFLFGSTKDIASETLVLFASVAVVFYTIHTMFDS